MAEKKLYDNLIQIIKGNSGPIEANETVLTEILDLQIPNGYCARIRKVIFVDNINADQEGQDSIMLRGALVMDSDDEVTYQIPTFTLEHDVVCDFEHEYQSFIGTVVGALGGSFVKNHRTIYVFDEDSDVVTVRNVRFNLSGSGLLVAGPNHTQVKCIVHFTYEKVGLDLYAKLLGIK